MVFWDVEIEITTTKYLKKIVDQFEDKVSIDENNDTKFLIIN